MFKNDFNGLGLHILCDRCKTIVGTMPYKFDWVRVDSRHKGAGAGKGRALDFCNEKCRILFLRGREYYCRKMKYIADNDKRMDGN